MSLEEEVQRVIEKIERDQRRIDRARVVIIFAGLVMAWLFGAATVLKVLQ